MGQVNIQSELYTVIQNMAEENNITIGKMTNALLEKQLRVDSECPSKCSYNEVPSMKDLLILFMDKLTIKQRKRFSELCNQIDIDPKCKEKILTNLSTWA